MTALPKIKWYVCLVFILLIFTPALIEHFVYAQGQIDLLPWAKILAHFILPILFVTIFLERSFTAVSLEPIRPWPKHNLWRDAFITAGLSVAAATVIIGSYFLLSSLVDVAGIAKNLTGQGISKETYIYVALWISFINPFMEEYFWRGFVFYRAYQFVNGVWPKRLVLIGTGFLFALHHTIIIQPWFNWWQFTLVTLFLAAAGVIFNLLYLRSGSIIPSLLVHAAADLSLAFLGFKVFGIL